jgi:hypothetical protein
MVSAHGALNGEEHRERGARGGCSMVRDVRARTEHDYAIAQCIQRRFEMGSRALAPSTAMRGVQIS